MVLIGFVGVGKFYFSYIWVWQMDVQICMGEIFEVMFDMLLSGVVLVVEGLDGFFLEVVLFYVINWVSEVDISVLLLMVCMLFVQWGVELLDFVLWLCVIFQVVFVELDDEMLIGFMQKYFQDWCVLVKEGVIEYFFLCME